jgi:hypothetical protein
MQRPFAALHGTLGSFYQEGSADTVACLLVLGA